MNKRQAGNSGLEEIRHTLSGIRIPGDRYPESHQKMIDRCLNTDGEFKPYD